MIFMMHLRPFHSATAVPGKIVARAREESHQRGGQIFHVV
jgi:hypothetical protein